MADPVVTVELDPAQSGIDEKLRKLMGDEWGGWIVTIGDAKKDITGVEKKKLPTACVRPPRVVWDKITEVYGGNYLHAAAANQQDVKALAKGLIPIMMSNGDDIEKHEGAYIVKKYAQACSLLRDRGPFKLITEVSLDEIRTLFNDAHIHERGGSTYETVINIMDAMAGDKESTVWEDLKGGFEELYAYMQEGCDSTTLCPHVGIDVTVIDKDKIGHTVVGRRDPNWIFPKALDLAASVDTTVTAKDTLDKDRDVYLESTVMSAQEGEIILTNNNGLYSFIPPPPQKSDGMYYHVTLTLHTPIGEEGFCKHYTERKRVYYILEVGSKTDSGRSAPGLGRLRYTTSNNNKVSVSGKRVDYGNLVDKDSSPDIIRYWTSHLSRLNSADINALLTHFKPDQPFAANFNKRIAAEIFCILHDYAATDDIIDGIKEEITIFLYMLMCAKSLGDSTHGIARLLCELGPTDQQNIFVKWPDGNGGGYYDVLTHDVTVLLLCCLQDRKKGGGVLCIATGVNCEDCTGLYSHTGTFTLAKQLRECPNPKSLKLLTIASNNKKAASKILHNLREMKNCLLPLSASAANVNLAEMYSYMITIPRGNNIMAEFQACINAGREDFAKMTCRLYKKLQFNEINDVILLKDMIDKMIVFFEAVENIQELALSFLRIKIRNNPTEDNYELLTPIYGLITPFSHTPQFVFPTLINHDADIEGAVAVVKQKLEGYCRGIPESTFDSERRLGSNSIIQAFLSDSGDGAKAWISLVTGTPTDMTPPTPLTPIYFKATDNNNRGQQVQERGEESRKIPEIFYMDNGESLVECVKQLHKKDPLLISHALGSARVESVLQKIGVIGEAAAAAARAITEYNKTQFAMSVGIEPIFNTTVEERPSKKIRITLGKLAGKQHFFQEQARVVFPLRPTKELFKKWCSSCARERKYLKRKMKGGSHPEPDHHAAVNYKEWESSLEAAEAKAEAKAQRRKELITGSEPVLVPKKPRWKRLPGEWGNEFLTSRTDKDEIIQELQNMFDHEIIHLYKRCTTEVVGAAGSIDEFIDDIREAVAERGVATLRRSAAAVAISTPVLEDFLPDKEDIIRAFESFHLGWFAGDIPDFDPKASPFSSYVRVGEIDFEGIVEQIQKYKLCSMRQPPPILEPDAKVPKFISTGYENYISWVKWFQEETAAAASAALPEPEPLAADAASFALPGPGAAAPRPGYRDVGRPGQTPPSGVLVVTPPNSPQPRKGGTQFNGGQGKSKRKRRKKKQTARASRHVTRHSKNKTRRKGGRKRSKITRKKRKSRSKRSN